MDEIDSEMEVLLATLEQLWIAEDQATQSQGAREAS